MLWKYLGIKGILLRCDQVVEARAKAQDVYDLYPQNHVLVRVVLSHLVVCYSSTELAREVATAHSPTMTMLTC